MKKDGRTEVVGIDVHNQYHLVWDVMIDDEPRTYTAIRETPKFLWVKNTKNPKEPIRQVRKRDGKLFVGGGYLLWLTDSQLTEFVDNGRISNHPTRAEVDAEMAEIDAMLSA